MEWMVVLVISLILFVIGWWNLNYYDELVPRKVGVIDEKITVIEIPTTLTPEEKIIQRYKTTFIFLGIAGSFWSILHLSGKM